MIFNKKLSHFMEQQRGLPEPTVTMPWMACAERPMDGLEASRRSATALLLHIAYAISYF
ncbi:hypothetical protein GCM10007082_20840 [Oceanisphaera arctica]|nr:hypothetical protein GCM10007082_20840 [Oceanisphaera arctica]